MKRTLIPAAAALSLCILLCGCGDEKNETQPDPTAMPEIVQETPSATFRPDEEYASDATAAENVPDTTTDAEEDLSAEETTDESTGEDAAAEAQGEDTAAEMQGEDTAEAGDSDTEADASQWQLASFSNATLQVAFKYPEGWTSDPSVDTITFVEPVDEGDTGARFSITSYEFTGAKPSTSLLKNELGVYLKKLYKSYNDSKTGKVQSNIAIADSKAMHCDYDAVKGNNYVKGFVGMGYGKNNRVYVMHFVCLEEDYEYFKPLIYELSQNISVMKSK